jgi:hypothetical protein
MVQVVVTPEVICLAIAVMTGAVGSDPQAPRAVAATERAASAVSAHFREWVADPSSEGAAAIRERVELGAPPVALVALLDALRTTPRAELVDVIQSLATYRNPQVRAHAIAAWAEQGELESLAAIAAASIDLEPKIRALVPAIAAKFPSEEAQQMLVDLLARDEALAKALAEANE